MKHTLKKLSDTQVQVTVSVSAEDLAGAKTKALNRLARTVKVAGFRKGKVPANVAEKHLDPNVLGNQVAENAVNTTLGEIVMVENIRVLDQPRIELTKFVPYTDMEYVATIEVLPDIKLGNYRKLKAKRGVTKVEQRDVDDVLARVTQSLADKRDMTRPAQLGDEVVIDFAGKKDGEPFDGGTAKDYALVLGSESFIPGFEAAIVGHAAGESFEVPLTFPKEYHSAELKGQDVVFDVVLHKVMEVTTPELTDEIAKKVGPFETVKDLVSDIERELQAQGDRQAEGEYHDALVQELVKGSKLPLPKVLVDDQLKSLLQDATQNLMYRGMTVEEYCEKQGYKDTAEWQEKEFFVTAESRVKAGLVLAELAKVENITVSREELDARVEEMLRQSPHMKAQLETPEVRGDIVNRLVTEKTLERLVELNS